MTESFGYSKNIPKASNHMPYKRNERKKLDSHPSQIMMFSFQLDIKTKILAIPKKKRKLLSQKKK